MRPVFELGGDAKVVGEVYVLVDKLGIVRYVGSTKDFARRMAEHGDFARQNNLRFHKIFGTDDAIERQILEQVSINAYGGVNGQLLNKINVISKRSKLFRQLLNE